MAQRVLITGARGFLGRYAALQFSQAGHDVSGIGHGEMSPLEMKSWGLSSWHSADITPDTLVEYAGAPDVIVHCAGSGSVACSIAHPYQDFLQTVSATAAVLEYMRTHAPAARLVYPSSAAVYGNAERLPISERDALHPVSPYGIHKFMSENLCRSYAEYFGMSVAVVRFFSVYGCELRKQLLWEASRKILAGENGFFGSGAEIRDWLHAKDAARLLLVAAEHASNACPVVNGGTGVGVTVREVLIGLFEGLGRNDTPTFSGVSRPGDPLGYVADTARVAAWGWRPEIAMADGLKEYLAWFRSHAQ